MTPADKGKRFLAYIVDSLIWGMLSNMLGAVFFVPFFFLILFIDSSRSVSTLIMLTLCCLAVCYLVIALVASYFYYIWMPVKKWRGATLGKKLLGLRVVKTDGSNVGQGTLLLRELIGKPISGMVFYLGYIWILIDEKGQAWHDLLSTTIVIEDDKKS